MKSFTFAALAAVASCVMAQDTVAAYGQCGGSGYDGVTACAQGYMCHSYNDFYSQCVAGDSSAASQGAATASQVASSSVHVAVASTTVVIASTSAIVASSVSAVSKVAVSSSKPVAVSSSTPATSLVATTLQTKVVATSSSAAAAVSTTTSSSNSTNPSASGTQFTIDGETGYFPGTNSYWISFLTNNSDVDLVMQHLADSGLKILRVWGFNDVTTTPTDGTVYFQSFAGTEPVINTGSDGLERLDYVVKSAEAHGIKLIINFVNNWTDYGGMAAYFTYAGISDNTEWYNNTLAQTQYQKYIEAVVSRYSNSTAIFAWELANEPRCTSCDLSVLKTWVSDTASYIKTLDPAHMVTTGEEGFGLGYGDDGSYPYTTGAGGSNFTANCADANIDFCTYHLYPESWGTSPTQEWGNEWITNHNTACAAVGKPCLLEEFGASNNCTVESSWQATALAAVATAGDLFWQLGDTLSTGETSQDGNTVYYKGDLWSCLVTEHVEAVDAA